MHINDFGPFEADVWGSVSDWMMVVVTTLTAIFLIKTFKSQKKVQMMQQSITDIENERYRIEHRPKFEITPIKIENKELDKGIRSYLLFKLSLIENEAKDVEVVDKLGTYLIESISISEGPIGQHMPISIVHPKNEYKLHFLGFPNSVLFKTEGSYFSFSLNFKDTIGNAYNQLFSLSFKEEVFSNFTSKNAERVFIETQKQSKLKQLTTLIKEWF